MRQRVTESRIIEVLTALKAALEANRGRFIALHNLMDAIGISSGLKQAVTKMNLVRAEYTGIKRTAAYVWDGGTIDYGLARKVMLMYVEVKQGWPSHTNRTGIKAATFKEETRRAKEQEVQGALDAAMTNSKKAYERAEAQDALAEEDEDALLQEIHSDIELLDERLDLMEKYIQEIHGMVRDLYKDLRG